MLKQVLYFLLLISIASLTAQDVERGFKQSNFNSGGNSEQKVALIIGNSNYKDSPLTNPVNDARSIAQALRDAGFDVILRENQSSVEIKRAVREFGSRLQNGGTGLFYYAGHGMQVKGDNYLIPINAEIYNEEEVEYEAVNLGLVMAQMENARNSMNIIILDACRNNPFARSFRSMEKGLASINAPTGTIIAYATGPGKVAADGSGSNGLYTEELLAQIKLPGLKIEDVFKRVRINVIKRSNNQQIPWESSSLVGDFYFSEGSNQSSTNNLTTNNNFNQNNNATTNQTSSNSDNSGNGYNYGSSLGSSYVKAEWQSDGTSYWLYVDDIAIQNETVGNWSGSDLIVYHDKTKRTYLFRNYSGGGDNRRYPAELLSSYYEAFWKATSEGYWIFYKGNTIQKETVNSWTNDDLLVYHSPTKANYLLRNYEIHKDGQLRPVEVLYSSSSAFWRTNGKEYWLYVNGETVNTETISEWYDNDLLVFRLSTGLYYHFKEYTNRGDNQLRPAEIFTAPNKALWRATETGYWLYQDGKAINAETTSEWSGNDLIVTHTSTGRQYNFRNYENYKDNVLRPAELLSQAPTATWRSDGNTYWLYVNGEYISSVKTVQANGDDFIVYSPVTTDYYLFRNYSNFQDNQLRPAEIIKSPNGVLWFATDAGYWMFYNGESIQANTSSAWSGDDLIVTYTSTGSRYILRTYASRKDNQPRAAESY